jgi:lysozyme
MVISDCVIDISHYNGTSIDFQAVFAAGVRGVIHKASQGTSYADPCMAANQKACQAVGLLWGTYHFGDGSPGWQQAKHYLDTAKPRPGELMAVDLETNPGGPSMSLREAHAFVVMVHNRMGRWPVLYSGHTVKDMLGNHPDPLLARCPLWLAQYGETAVVPPGWSTWSLWQYTDAGQVDGVGYCDRSMFQGGINDLPEFWESVSPSP